MSKALNYLGIARMSGNIELGEENAKALVKAGKARIVLLASDASDGVKKRAEGYVYGFHAPLVTLPFTKAELGGAVGRAQCAVAAIRDLGLAKSLAEALAAEHGEAYAGAAEALGKTQARITARKTARGSKTGKRRKRNEQL
jgi:ribosomal protein L7Ae-like RNA K-turn-binding protein